jgi:sugar phosphate isomerase/epimerase
MRLGGHLFYVTSIEELEPVCEKLDCYGLSTIPAPPLEDMSEDECVRFSEAAGKLDITIGETGFWDNLLTPDKDLQSSRIAEVRATLKKAETIGCKCVVVLVGTKDPSEHCLAPHPYMYTDEAKAEFREVVLRILDGIELEKTGFGIEPWHNTFFYQPEDIRDFIDDVGHPRFGLHLDQMNMVNQDYFYRTGELINKTFDLLSDKVLSVHLKDIRCDFDHMFLKWDEVFIGDGVMDYDTYLKRLSGLPEDTPCFCEHLELETEYALNFSRLHYLADKAGVKFKRRTT